MWRFEVITARPLGRLGISTSQELYRGGWQDRLAISLRIELSTLANSVFARQLVEKCATQKLRKHLETG